MTQSLNFSAFGKSLQKNICFAFQFQSQQQFSVDIKVTHCEQLAYYCLNGVTPHKLPSKKIDNRRDCTAYHPFSRGSTSITIIMTIIINK